MSHRTSSFALACFLILLSTTQGQTDGKYGQFAPPDAFEDDSGLAYYGSENEWDRRQFSQKKADAGYKRRGQRQLLAILNGQEEEARRLAGLRLDQDPQDLEAMFTRTAAYCRLGRLDDALESMSAAVDAGLPVERFLAGPRDLLAPLTNHPKFQELARKQTTGLIHGPMLGALTHRSARVWVRTPVTATVPIPVYKADAPHRPTGGEVVRAEAKSDPQTDFTAVVSIEGLEPSTRYVYDVLINESSVLRTKSLPAITTFPTDPRHQTLRFAVGGGAGFTPAHERIWDTIADQEPDALLLLGDNVYIDLPEKPRGLHQYTYYRRQSRPEFRRLVSSTPVFAIWDDHDCALDDVWMGPYLDRPSWKPDMLRVFQPGLR